jgi:glucose/arabinose dehydrogenase
MRQSIAVVVAVTSAVGGAAPAQSLESPNYLEGPMAFGDWRSDGPGVSRKIMARDLPQPYASEPKAERAKIVKRPENAALNTLPGFTVGIFATGLEGPRVLRFAPNGDLFVTESFGGRLRVLRPDASSAKPAQDEIFAEGLERPYGIAFYPPGAEPKYVYVGTPSKVVRFPYRSGALKASGPAETVAALPSDGGHWTRDLAFSPDGKTLYVSVGSKTNVAEGHSRPSAAEIEALEKSNGLGASDGPELHRADVLAFDPDGGAKRVFATGLRNCSGLAIRPHSDELWCVVNERDMLGDNLPTDYATRVTKNGFYGWPWYYIGSNVDPRHAGDRPDLVGKVTTPDVLIQAHSAPLGLSFYDGGQFPAKFKGDAFVALHGSWNRAKRAGYKIIRLKFKDGAPTGEYEDFVTGFVIDDANVWGRPVDVVPAPDGALLFSEDGNGTIWRVSYGDQPSKLLSSGSKN